MWLLILAWICAAFILYIVKPAASVGLVLFVALLIAASVLYIIGPGGPWWRGGDGS